MCEFCLPWEFLLFMSAGIFVKPEPPVELATSAACRVRDSLGLVLALPSLLAWRHVRKCRKRFKMHG